MLTFWGEDEIINYAAEYCNNPDNDSDIETLDEALDCIKSDLNSLVIIRNLEDCFRKWRNATHKAPEIHHYIIEILQTETDEEIEEYEDAERYIKTIENAYK